MKPARQRLPVEPGAAHGEQRGHPVPCDARPGPPARGRESGRRSRAPSDPADRAGRCGTRARPRPTVWRCRPRVGGRSAGCRPRGSPSRGARARPRADLRLPHRRRAAGSRPAQSEGIADRRPARPPLRPKRRSRSSRVTWRKVGRPCGSPCGMRVAKSWSDQGVHLLEGKSSGRCAPRCGRPSPPPVALPASAPRDRPVDQLVQELVEEPLRIPSHRTRDAAKQNRRRAELLPVDSQGRAARRRTRARTPSPPDRARSPRGKRSCCEAAGVPRRCSRARS